MARDLFGLSWENVFAAASPAHPLYCNTSASASHACADAVAFVRPGSPVPGCCRLTCTNDNQVQFLHRVPGLTTRFEMY